MGASCSKRDMGILGCNRPQKSRERRDWSELPNDILFEIIECLNSKSYHSFSLVCSSWRAVATINKQRYLKHFLCQDHWLMLPREKGSESPDMRKIYNVSSGKTRKIFLPEARHKVCLSFKDWLFINDLTPSLLHLVSRVQIYLPKIPISYHAYNFLKFVLSANPNSTSDFIVIICARNFKVYFCKPGVTSWTSIALKYGFSDILYYNEKLYALRNCPRNKLVVVTYDIHGPNPTQVQQFFRFPSMSEISSEISSKIYIVEFSNKILVVRRNMHEKDDTTYTYGFSVVCLDLDDNRVMMMDHLENKALFVGSNSLSSVKCSKFNKYKPNCIYFTNNIERRSLKYQSNDMGIYHLSNKRVTPLLKKRIISGDVTPALWIGPSF